MAKRFTDTGIWGKGWFRKLSPKLKEAWRYLCDNCDHAGIWDVDMATMSHFVNETVSFHEISDAFGPRIELLIGNKIFVRGFIEFQYNCGVEDLNPENKVHLSVIRILKKEGVLKALASPIQGLKDKDKEKDKDKVKEKEGGVGETKPTLSDLESVYRDYPRKEGRARGIKKLQAEIRSFADLELFKKAVFNYRHVCRIKKIEGEYIKHFSTFVGEWRDWLASDAGYAESFAPNPDDKYKGLFDANEPA